MLSLAETKSLKKYLSGGNERMPEIFEALSDNNRCKLFRLFVKRTNLNVGEVASILGISVPLASQHLKVLEKSRVLLRQKIGREVFYRVNDKDELVYAVVESILRSNSS